MGKLKHTPGPWRVGNDGKGDTVYSYAPGLVLGEHLITYLPINRYEGPNANAQLIAAAPDMAAALRIARFALSRNMGDTPDVTDMEAYSVVCAAIAKSGT